MTYPLTPRLRCTSGAGAARGERKGIPSSIPLRPPSTHADDGSSKPGTGTSPSIVNGARQPLAGTGPGGTAGNAESPADDWLMPKTRRYIVSAEETPQTISEAFHIPVKRLYAMNSLTPGSLMKAGAS